MTRRPSTGRPVSSPERDLRTRRSFLATVGSGVLGMSLATTAAAQTLSAEAPKIDAPSDRSWELTWADEFDGSINDAWSHETGGGCGEDAGLDTDCTWGNEEAQYYTAGDNAWVEDGSLVIEAREEPAPNGHNDYTSGRLKTQGEHTMEYGRLDVRATVPEGQGIWPAIWLLGEDISDRGWPGCGEIDVMEFLGHVRDTVHGTVHGPGYAGADGIGSNFTLETGRFSEGAHTFSIVWEPDRIDWYVDGTHFHSVTRKEVESAGDQWVFDHEFFILLNVAVGGRWPGYPDETTEFPQRMTVEYVRQFEAVEEPTTPELDPIEGTIPADLDGDGRHEDFDGDGQLTFSDVFTFFRQAGTSEVKTHVEAYDFTGDNSVTLADVVALLRKL